MLNLANINGEILKVEKQGKNSYKYFWGGKVIGVFSPETMEDKILFLEQNIKDLSPSIKDEITKTLEEISREEIENTPENLKQEKIEELEKVLLKENKIARVATIDLNEEVKEKEEKQQSKQEKKKKQEKIPIKQELRLEEKATDMKTLGQLLEAEGKLPKEEGKEYTKLGIVEVSDLTKTEQGEKQNNLTTRYMIVAMATDGTWKPLDIEMDYQEGNNPTETIYQVGQNSEVEQDQVLSRFKIGQGTFSIKNGKYGELEVYHSPRKTLGGKDIEGNKSLDRQLSTDNVYEMKKEERDLAGEHNTGYRSIERGYQEGNAHKDCDEKKTSDIDGDLNTQTHSHYTFTETGIEFSTGEKISYQEIANKWGGYYKQENAPNIIRIINKIKELAKHNPDKELGKIIEIEEDNMNEWTHERNDGIA